MTEKQLQALYRRYNKKYFDGKLPADIPVKFVDLAPTDMCAMTTMFAENGVVLQVIYVDSRFKDWDLLAKFSLLHEMCHVKLQPVLRPEIDPHGQEFDEEMLRLAFRGAFHKIW